MKIDSKNITLHCLKQLSLLVKQGNAPYRERNTTVIVDICGEGIQGNLTCTFGTIKTLSAFYGRMSYTTCKKDPMKTASCSIDVTSKVAAL